MSAEAKVLTNCIDNVIILLNGIIRCRNKEGSFMKKKLVAGLLSLVLLAGSAAVMPEGFSEKTGLCMSVGAEDVLKQGDFEYYVNDDGTAHICNYTGKNNNLIIPSKIDGRKVTMLDGICYPD